MSNTISPHTDPASAGFLFCVCINPAEQRGRRQLIGMRSFRKLHVITSVPFLPGKRLPSNATQDTPRRPNLPTPYPRRTSPFDDLGATPQARVQHRGDHLRELRRRGAHRRQRRRPHRHPGHPRSLRQTRRARARALPAPAARATGRGHVIIRSATPIQTAKTSIGPDAATTPQGRARPAVGNR